MTLKDIKDFFSSRYTHPWSTLIHKQSGKVLSIIDDEKKQGLDVEAQSIPVFFNKWESIKAALWLMLLIGMEGGAAWMYVRNPEKPVGPGAIFMLGMAGMMLYATMISTWYPLMRTKVDERKVRRYVRIQQWWRRFCLAMNLIISLTPFWCYLLAEKLSDYGEAHGWEPWVSRDDYESNGWTMGMVTFLFLTSLVLMIWILTDSFGSEKSIKRRLRYLYYRSGEIEKADIKLKNDIFRKMELVELKKKEIAKQEEELAKMEKEIALMRDQIKIEG